MRGLIRAETFRSLTQNFAPAHIIYYRLDSNRPKPVGKATLSFPSEDPRLCEPTGFDPIADPVVDGQGFIGFVIPCHHGPRYVEMTPGQLGVVGPHRFVSIAPFNSQLGFTPIIYGIADPAGNVYVGSAILNKILVYPPTATGTHTRPTYSFDLFTTKATWSATTILAG